MGGGSRNTRTRSPTTARRLRKHCRVGDTLRASDRNMSLREILGLKARKPAAGARIIVVSNRLPLTLKKTEHGWDTVRSSGGLASAMNPLLGKTGGEWVGWAGDSGGEDSQKRQ